MAGSDNSFEVAIGSKMRFHAKNVNSWIQCKDRAKMENESLTQHTKREDIQRMAEWKNERH